MIPRLLFEFFCCAYLMLSAVVTAGKTLRIVENPVYFDFSKDDERVHLTEKDFARADRDIVPDEIFDPKIMLKNRLVEGDIDGYTHEEFKNWVFQINEIWTLRQTGRLASSATADLLKRWPNGRVPYYLSSRYEPDARTKIAQAIQLFHEKSCVKFVPRFEETDYIYIQPKQDYICSSVIGQNGGEQLISLGKGCFGLATVFHELMHVLGFYHEQSRNDRDEFIRIVWSNISPNDTINFAKYPLHMIDHLRTTYDYGSVMHYGAKYFSINGQDTIIPLKPLQPGVMLGQTVGPSEIDLERINRLYQCPGYEGKGKATKRPGGGRTLATTPRPSAPATTEPLGPVFPPFPGGGLLTTPAWPEGQWGPNGPNPFGPGGGSFGPFGPNGPQFPDPFNPNPNGPQYPNPFGPNPNDPQYPDSFGPNPNGPQYPDPFGPNPNGPQYPDPFGAPNGTLTGPFGPLGPGGVGGLGDGSFVPGPGGSGGFYPDQPKENGKTRPSERLCAACQGCTGCEGCRDCPNCPDCPACPPCLPDSQDNTCPACSPCPRCPRCPKYGCPKCKECPSCPCDRFGRRFNKDGNLIPGQGPGFPYYRAVPQNLFHSQPLNVGAYYIPWIFFNMDKAVDTKTLENSRSIG